MRVDFYFSPDVRSMSHKRVASSEVDAEGMLRDPVFVLGESVTGLSFAMIRRSSGKSAGHVVEIIGTNRRATLFIEVVG